MSLTWGYNLLSSLLHLCKFWMVNVLQWGRANFLPYRLLHFNLHPHFLRTLSFRLRRIFSLNGQSKHWNPTSLSDYVFWKVEGYFFDLKPTSGYLLSKKYIEPFHKVTLQNRNSRKRSGFQWLSMAFNFWFFFLIFYGFQFFSHILLMLVQFLLVV